MIHHVHSPAGGRVTPGPVTLAARHFRRCRRQFIKTGLIFVPAVAAVASTPLPVSFFKYSPSSAADPTLPVTANLVARWEADYITGLSNGDHVATWPDQSPSARDATQNTEPVNNTRPIYQTNIFGTKPAVHFDGNDSLHFSHTDVTNFTVFAAWNMDAIQAWTFGPLKWRNGSGGNGFTLGGDTSSGTNPKKHLVIWNPGENNFYGVDESLNLSSAPRGKAIDTWRWNGTTVTMRKNGAGQTVTSGGGSGYSIGQSDNLGLPYNYCGGWVAAVLVYSASLSDADVTAVESYLNTKYPCF